MFDSRKRFVSALVTTNKCLVYSLKKDDLKIILNTNSKKIEKSKNFVLGKTAVSDTLEDRFQNLAWNKMNSLIKNIENLKDVTENLRNTNKKKQVLVDEKSFDDVKYKIDREFEKAFLKQMTKMRIIKQPKINKQIENDQYPVTSFYNQLIKDNSRIELSKKISQDSKQFSKTSKQSWNTKGQASIEDIKKKQISFSKGRNQGK